MIYVTGGRAKQRQNVFRAAAWAWNYLMPRIRSCEVFIELKKIPDAHGYCLETENRVFDVEIDQRLKGDDFLTTIFHEMVHVKQGVRKEWNMNEISYKTHDEYLNLPWEKEAYELQEVMLEAWNTHLGSR